MSSDTHGRSRGNVSTGDDQLDIRPLTPDHWDDVVALFERPGPRGGTPIPGNCWCTAWRDEHSDRPHNKATFKGCLDEGRTPGLIGYRVGQPVGWVAVAPRWEHPRLERSGQYGPLAGDRDVYAITCFYVDRDHRGTGVSSALLDGAIQFARDAGASALDAFPKIDLPAHARASRRAEEDESFMGRMASYQSRGFHVVRDTGKRAVMRLAFDR